MEIVENPVEIRCRACCGRGVVASPESVVVTLARSFSLTVEEIIGPRRFERLMQARRAIAFTLDSRGFSAKEIGMALNRDRATVYGWLHEH